MLLDLILAADEKAPDANDVVAGWTGFAVFVALILAVAFLGWSLTKQLKKADRAKAEGVFGDVDDERVDEATDPVDADSPKSG